MNPELQQVRPSQEAMPQIPGGAEYFPDGTVRTPDVLRPTPESGEGRQEVQPQATPVAVPPLQSIALPQMSQTAIIQPTADPVGGTPMTAGDDDVMEQEWVDKVKKIITLTKGSPYEQARAIAALQADYLKKRYNRIIGETGE